MLVFWVAVFAVCEVIGCILHIYQTIMQTYYTKKSRKEQAERDKRDDEVANNMFSLRKQVTDYMILCSDYMEKVKSIQKQLEEKEDDTNTVH